MRSSGNPFENHVIIDPNVIGAGFDSMSHTRKRNNNNNTTEHNSSSDSSSKETTLDMEYLADLNLFMGSTKE